MLKSTFGWLATLALLVLTLTGCGEDDDNQIDNSQRSLAEIAANDGRFTVLSSLLERVDLDDVLDGTGPFTVFAPTDAAFGQIELDGLSDAEVRQILLYHVISGLDLPAADLSEGQTLVGTGSTGGPNGSQLTLLVEKNGAAVTVNNEASVVQADIGGTNGTIHAVNQVLFAQSLVDFVTKLNGFSALATALTDASLVPALQADGPFTVFAPNDAAFAAAAGTIATLTPDQVADVLRYHVIAGANVRAEDVMDGSVSTLLGQSVGLSATANNAVTVMDAQGNSVAVLNANIQASNGVIHGIGSVLIPQL